MINLQKKETITWESFGGELSLDAVSETRECLDDFMVI